MGSGRAGFRAALKVDQPRRAAYSLASDEPSISRIQATAQLIDRSRATVPGDMVVTGSIQEQDQRPVQETLGIAGCGGDRLRARSGSRPRRRSGPVGPLRQLRRSSEGAGGKALRQGTGGRSRGGKDRGGARVRRPLGDSFLVEAVVEDHPSKAALLSELARFARDDAVLSTTTSSFRSPSWRARPAPPSAFWSPRVQPRDQDEARRVGVSAASGARYALARHGLVRVARKDRRGSTRHPRVRCQPAAVPLSLQRGRADVRDRHGPEESIAA